MTTPSRNKNVRRRRATLGALFILLAAPTAYADDALSESEAPGDVTAAVEGLGLSPISGNMDLPVNVTIPAACPEGADSVIVQVTGGGFPADSNALGVTDILADPSQTSFPVGSWSQVATNNQISATTLTGTANLKLICLNGPTAQDYTGTVTFAGGEFEFGGEPSSPTPTPAGGTPTPTPTPTPAGGTPTPTPTPADATPTPTPAATPDATPTPEPQATPEPTDQGGAVTDGNSGLPDSGAHAGPMMLLAALLLCSGLLLLVLSVYPSADDREYT